MVKIEDSDISKASISSERQTNLYYLILPYKCEDTIDVL